MKRSSTCCEQFSGAFLPVSSTKQSAREKQCARRCTYNIISRDSGTMCVGSGTAYILTETHTHTHIAVIYRTEATRDDLIFTKRQPLFGNKRQIT